MKKAKQNRDGEFSEVDLNLRREKFLNKYSNLIPEFKQFLHVMKTDPPFCFRRNALKVSDNDFRQRLFDFSQQFNLNFNHNFYPGIDLYTLEETNFPFASSLEHLMGLFYIQGASSLLPVLALDPKPYEKILDLCAAPGGKSAFIAELMQNSGLLVSNEPNKQRNRVLKANLAKLGVSNAIVTKQMGQNFNGGVEFDKVLVDAPCTSEGTIRGNLKAVLDWNDEEDFRAKLHQLQKRIIQRAFDLLKVGGTLVYSTCTFDPLENEAALDFLLNKRSNAQIVDMGLDPRFSQGLSHYQDLTFNPDVVKARRVYPHQFNSWGFFYAKIIKH